MSTLLERQLNGRIGKETKITRKGEETLRGTISKEENTYSITDQLERKTVIEIAKIRAIQPLS